MFPDTRFPLFRTRCIVLAKVLYFSSMSKATGTKHFVIHLACLLVAAMTPCFSQAQHQRPNIVFILSDDHATKSISCYNGSINKTPHIDRIAQGGALFTNTFCTNAVCGPSRATILTGKLSHVNGMVNNEVVFDSSQSTLPIILRAEGYQTAVIGKWHLKSNPSGFDYWKVLPGQGEYFNPDFIENGVKIREEGYVTDLIAQHALRWMDRRDTTRPFFLLIGNKAPHRPWLPKPEYAMLYDTADISLPGNFFDPYTSRSDAARHQQMSIAKDLLLATNLKLEEGLIDDGSLFTDAGRLNPAERRSYDSLYILRNKSFYERHPADNEMAEWKFRRFINDYLATLQSVDDQVGAVLDYLKANGLEENTIVVYTSDQGYFLGEHGWFDKRFMYEESYRMPLLIRYPDKIKAGTVNDQLLMNIDFAPTLLDWAGIEKPSSMQGESFKDYIRSEKRLRDATYYHYFEFPGEHNVKRHYGIRTDRYKLIHYYHDIDAWELFDLQADPHEMTNLFDFPEHAGIQNGLMAQLKSLQTYYGDTLLKVPDQTIHVNNLLFGYPYAYRYSPSDKYPDHRGILLTDGMIEAPGSTLGRLGKHWTGFEGNDFEVTIGLTDSLKPVALMLRFLDLPDSWIFVPVKLVVTCKIDGADTVLHDPPILKKEFRATGGSVHQYHFKLPAAHITQIKIKAVNRGTCPQGHPGEGKPAWIFCDEVLLN